MDLTIRKYTSFDEMKAGEYRYWQSRPVHERMDAVEEMMRETHDRWRHLVFAHKVRGVQVHDTRLAASMYVHGVTQLPTVNVRDFQRFPFLRIVHPSEVVRST